MRIFLDSTEFINFLRADPSTFAVFNKLLVSGYPLVTSAINIAEVYSGIRPRELEVWQELLGELEVYPVTLEIGRHAGELRNSAARKGRTLTLDDMIVAATCLAYDCVLLADNRKDFATIDGLRLLNREQ